MQNHPVQGKKQKNKTDDGRGGLFSDLSGYNQSGISSYIMYQITKRFELFARYDRLASVILPEESVPWNLKDDGSAIITGIQFQPIKMVKIALDYQDWYPYASNMQNLTYIFLNLEVSFKSHSI